jgi:CO dehydrogenase maturation factor
MPLRIAIAGKGGSGKTTVAALLCRSLVGRQVAPLLAVDADPNSCLPERLGIPVEQTIGEMREELRGDPESVPAGMSKRDWIERLIHEDIAEGSRIDMLVMGRQEGPGCYCYINSVLRDCLESIGRSYRGVVIDNEAGLEHLSRRTNGDVEILLVVCPPTLIGARTADRVVHIARGLQLGVGSMFLVLNPADADPAPEAAAAFAATGVEVIGRIPRDPAVLACDEHGKPLSELPPDSPAVNAVDEIVKALASRRLL